MFYNGLTSLDGSLTPQPALAESFTTKDAKTWVFKLRKGVTFHDGKPLTPADVVFSIMRHKDPATASQGQGAGRPDRERQGHRPERGDDRARRAPNADLPVILGTFHFHIVKEGTTDFTAGIGTGPYKLKEFKPGVRSVAVRNENYWKPGKPYLDEIEFVGIGDESARVNALLSGGMDLVGSVNPRSVERVTGTPGFAVFETKSGQYTDLIMRKDIGPGSNPDFVLAMKYLFDREQMKKSIALDHGGGRQRPADRPDQPLLLRGPAAAAVRSRKAKFHLQKAGHHRHGAGGRVARGAVLGRDGAGDAAGGAADRPGPRRQAHAGRRLLVQPLDEHPVGFGNVNPRPSADIAADAVLQVRRAVERVALEEREVRPAAASPRAARPTRPSASRCMPTCRR